MKLGAVTVALVNYTLLRHVAAPMGGGCLSKVAPASSTPPRLGGWPGRRASGRGGPALWASSSGVAVFCMRYQDTPPAPCLIKESSAK